MAASGGRARTRTRAGSRPPSAAARGGRGRGRRRRSGPGSCGSVGRRRRGGRASPRTPAAGTPRSVSRTWVEIVGAGVISRPAPRYPPRMGTLQIVVGDLHFSARWEPAAPRTVEAIRRMLPIDVEAHPLPLDRRIDVDPVRRLPARPRLREPHLASGARPAGDLPGRHQRVRDLLPVRRLHDGVEGRPAGGQPLRDASSPTRAGTTGCARWAGAACGRAPRRSRSARSSGSTGAVTCASTDPVVDAQRSGRVGSTAHDADVVIRAAGRSSTAAGSRVADVADRGRADRRGRAGPVAARAAGPARSIDATGLLVLPGVVDVHTHTRVATDAEPDRFFQDSVAAAFGGTTTFLAFNNPGTGSSPAAAALAPGRRRRVPAGHGRRDWRDRLRREPGDPRRHGRPDRRAAGDGRRGRADREGVHGLRLPARRPRDLRGDAGPRRARRDAPGPLRGSRSSSTRPSRPRCSVATRHRATTRRRDHPRPRRSRPHRAMAFARAADAPVHVVHLSCAAALRHVADAKAAGVRAHAETCPHYLDPDRRALRRPRSR